MRKYRIKAGSLYLGDHIKCCPMHGPNGCACGDWCAMFEEIGGESEGKSVKCYAYDVEYPIQYEDNRHDEKA